MVLKSEKFDDVYFSADDGMAETEHVFIKGNDLPEAWQGVEAFTIAETGLGTGLNFLTVWKLFEETASPGQRLHFLSVEKFPLSKGDIKNALEQWGGELDPYLDRVLARYPIRVPGPHKIHITDRVTLTVWFGDVNDVLSDWTEQVDAWFLDGFTPAKNPEMWSDELFQSMARLSHDQTTYATFTAAGFVRRGLEGAGFSVKKVKGFGRKRDMICGRFEGEISKQEVGKPQSVAIVGGGLAGCAMAYCLTRYGIKSTIYEAGETLASAASGGKLGMINPKLTAKPTAHSDYYAAAYAHALRVLGGLEGVDFKVHGSLHLCTDDDKKRRFDGYTKNLGWHEDHMHYEGDNLYYPNGASVSPYKLSHTLAQGTDVRLNHKIESLDDLKEDVIVLANGYALNDLVDDDLPVNSVRGQVSWIKPQNGVDQNICFGGYITPRTPEGFHVLGSSFQPWDTSVAVCDDDHADNIDRYNKATNNNLQMDDIMGGWAALRTSSKDRFPIVGQLKDNIYVSIAHGSHGIISSLMAAEIIVTQLFGEAVPASRQVLKALNPKRFHKC